jgi:ABC transporter substrate binding protein
MGKKVVGFLLASLVLVSVRLAEAQQPKKIPRIGFLCAPSPVTVSARIEAFRPGLRELGYIEGQNVVVEYRYAEGKLDRLPDLAAELVRLPVDVIVAAGGMQAVRAAKNATNMIPIVVTGQATLLVMALSPAWHSRVVISPGFHSAAMMFSHSSNTAWFFSVLMALIFSLSLAGLLRLRATPVLGHSRFRTTPRATSTPPADARRSLATPRGSPTPASDSMRFFSNTTGNFNTAIGNGANVSDGNLTNATAIGNGATVNASNKIRLGDAAVNVIEGQVAFTASSDKTQKENFQPVDGEEVLGKIRGFELSSWNFIGHDPKEFRHYGPWRKTSLRPSATTD